MGTRAGPWLARQRGAAAMLVHADDRVQLTEGFGALRVHSADSQLPLTAGSA